MTTEADADIRRRETADWFARLNQRQVSTADIKAFSAWRRDDENARAFDRMQAFWDASRALSDQPDMVALTVEARSRSSTGPGRRARRVGVLAPIGAVGAVVMAVAIGWWTWSSQQARPYFTQVGERQVVDLADGSSVLLDTASRIEVRMTGETRLITLTAGQARFDVRPDPDRPFVVVAGDTRVTALGTLFDVRRLGAGARVILVEGRVEVRDENQPGARWDLAPGQQLETAARQPHVAATDLASAASWTAGRLTFEETPIGVAVAEMNRYTRRPIELRVGDLSAVRVSGVFDAGDIDGFVAALRDLYDLEVSRSEDGRVVLTASYENNPTADLG
ncbi:FecR domain-containing protein [Brevundimonas albigilva]|uniref:FecR family protein n=1 Tax=Brevundimonas albigilva TaxID=1312364 RepID=UPI00201B8120|nr:FecR domain-containing protein [Brevundimonas albigilva]UQV18927.1 FecR domain-containing protein [Brevundimonas albigilva]